MNPDELNCFPVNGIDTLFLSFTNPNADELGQLVNLIADRLGNSKWNTEIDSQITFEKNVSGPIIRIRVWGDKKLLLSLLREMIPDESTWGLSGSNFRDSVEGI